MEIVFTAKAEMDIEAWGDAGNYKVRQKIQELTEAILVAPFVGIGKPEPLKHDLSGLWLRRITRSDRYVYEERELHIIVHSLKGHY